MSSAWMSVRRWTGLVMMVMAVALASGCGGGGGGGSSDNGGSNPTAGNGNDNGGNDSGGNDNGSDNGNPDAVGAVIVASSATDGVVLSAFPFDAAAKVEATPSDQITIPTTPPANGCGGGNFKVKATDPEFHLMFIDFSSGSNHVLCAYSTDPKTGKITEKFNFGTISGAVVVDTTNHVAGSLYHAPYLHGYTADGPSDTELRFNLTSGVLPQGQSIQEISFENNLLWYATSDDGAISLAGVCAFTFSEASGYHPASPCTAFAEPAQPAYAASVGRDFTNGLFLTRSVIASTDPCTATSVYLYSYDVASGVLDQATNPAQTDIGDCAQIARNGSGESDEQGDVDFSKGLIFGLGRTGGLQATPYPFTAAGFGEALSPVTLTLHVRDPILDPVNHLFFFLTGTESAMTGISAYPYDESGFKAIVNNSITLDDAASPECPQAPCIKPLLAIVH